MLGNNNIRFSYSFLDKFCIKEKLPNSNDLILKSRDSHELLLMKQIDIQSQQYDETVATLEYQKGLSHEQLLSLVDYHAQPAHSKIIVLYEFCRISLQCEFENRLEEKRHFDESQLWSIFTSFVFGLAYLQKSNVGHGSISLYDCFLNKQGFLKVSDPTCATSNPYSIIKGYFYSPQILRCLLNQTEQQINIFKSDVFSLGCCMLQLTLMKDISLLFDYKNGFIDKVEYRNLMFELEKVNFSKQYTSFIYQMLLVDYHQRPDFITLQTEIFNVLAVQTNQQCSLPKKQLEIKSSISSLFRSKGQSIFQVTEKQQFLDKSQLIQLHQTEFQNTKYIAKIENQDKYNHNISSDQQFQPTKKRIKQKIANFKNQINNCLQYSNQCPPQLRDNVQFSNIQSKNNCQLMKFNEQKRKRNKSNKTKNIEVDTLSSFDTDFSANSQILPIKNQKMINNKQLFGSNSVLVEKKYQNKQNILHQKYSIKTNKCNKNYDKNQNVYTNPDFLKMMQMDVQQIIGRRIQNY